MNCHNFRKLRDPDVLGNLSLWSELHIWQLGVLDLLLWVLFYRIFESIDLWLSGQLEFLRSRSRHLLLQPLQSMNQAALLTLEVLDVLSLEHLIET